MDELALLKPKLARLKLSGMLDTLSERLSQALAEQWSYTQFLDMLLTDEAERRDFKQLGRRLTKSGLAPDKTLETFDFSFNPRIHAPTLRELATCRFVERAENVLVHHMAKRSRRNLGQSLRGSSDLHAWTDSACYLVRRPDDRLQLTVEHRSAPAPDPLLLRLSGGGDQPLSLLVDSADAPPPPLPEAVRAALRSARQPLSRTVLRQRLRVNNARLGVALQTVHQRGLAVRSPNGWHLPS